MKPLTPDDVELIRTVNAHLKSLSMACAHDADEATVRVASAPLRVLLVDDMLTRAWHATGIGGPITIRAWCIVSTEGDDVVAYAGGGDILPGVPASMCRGAKLAELVLNMKDFRNRTRIQIGSARVSTVELIQYVANTRGGIHFDLKGGRKASQKAAFDLLRQYDADIAAGLGVMINDRNLLHHEVLSVAQAVLRSPEVERMRRWSPLVSSSGRL
jgi:hypothetical protein